MTASTDYSPDWWCTLCGCSGYWGDTGGGCGCECGHGRRPGTATAIRDRGPELTDPAEAVFDPSRAYRYLLTRTWDRARPPIAWVMLNPSTADAIRDDPTVRRCIAFARASGAGGIVVTNLFAYRAANPIELLRAADPVGALNDAYIRSGCKPAATVVAAWGVHGRLRGRAATVTRNLIAAGTRLQCLGTTRDGHPRHPLYVSRTTKLRPYHETEPA